MQVCSIACCVILRLWSHGITMQKNNLRSCSHALTFLLGLVVCICVHLSSR